MESLGKLRRRKTVWPDAHLSVGRHLKRLGNKGCWEAIGPAREAFLSVAGEIKTYLDQNIDPLPCWVTWSIYMVGNKADAATPTIIFCSESEKIRREIKKIIDESDILAQHPGIKTRHMSKAPEFTELIQLAEEGDDMSTPEASPITSNRVQIYRSRTDNVVGMQIFVQHGEETKLATVGGTLQCGNDFYYFTAAHPFCEDDTADTPSTATSSSEYELKGSSDSESEDLPAEWHDGTSLGSITPDYVKSNPNLDSSDELSPNSLELQRSAASSSTESNRMKPETLNREVAAAATTTRRKSRSRSRDHEGRDRQAAQQEPEEGSYERQIREIDRREEFRSPSPETRDRRILIIREREREFDDDTSVRSARGSAPRHVTTVRRYKYPESERGDNYHAEDTKMVIREKEREVDPKPREHVRYRVVERERERDSDTISRRGTERDVQDVRSSYRIIERREKSRSPSPETVEDRLAPARSPYQLKKHSKSTKYSSRPEPQTIITRQETPQPIVIREVPLQQQVIIRERSEPSYELIEHSEAVDSRQVVRREPEEDYYYERRTREIDRPRRRERDYDDDDRDYYSGDDAIYVRRERDADDSYKRDHSPHYKRHLLEGTLAGGSAVEVLRHHRKSRAENPGSQLGQLVGYGALGSVGAEAIARSRNRSRSRSRSRDSQGRGRSRSRSRQANADVAAVLGALAFAAGERNSVENAAIIDDIPKRSVYGARSYGRLREVRKIKAQILFPSISTSILVSTLEVPTSWHFEGNC
jgi:hypothetical protein